MNGFFKKEALKFGAYAFHKAFPVMEESEIKSLGHDVSKVPVIYQEDKPGCVECTVTWIVQALYAVPPALDWKWLYKWCKGPANPSVVMDFAQKNGIAFIGNESNKARLYQYLVILDLRPQSLYQALQKGYLAIGTKNWGGDGPHMMAGYDVTEDGKRIKCATWDNPKVQGYAEVPFEQVTFAACMPNQPATVTSGIKVEAINVIVSKISNLFSSGRNKSILGIVGLAVIALLTGGIHTDQSQLYGAAGIYDQYAPVVAGAGQQASDTTLVVNTLTLYTGETINATDTNLFPVYFVVNPNGTDREKEECNSLNASTLTFGNCYRGLSAKCANTTSTVAGAAQPHSAGERIIMSNDSCFYNRFLDTSTVQYATGTKNFTAQSLVVGTSSTGMNMVVFNQGQGASNPFVFATGPTSTGWGYGNPANTFLFNAAGTVIGASSTRGLFLTNSLMGINASTTQGLLFDSIGNLALSVSSTPSLNGGYEKFNSSGQLFWDALGFEASTNTWTNTQNFNASTIFNTTTTFNSDILITNPGASTGTSIVNQNFVNNAVSANSATGTAAVTITAGQSLYMSATSSRIGLATSAATSTAYYFIGISTSAASSGTTVTYAKPGGVAQNLSGLTTGKFYYLSNTDGTLAATPGTIPVRVGLALSTNSLLVLTPGFHARVSGQLTGWSVASVSASIGFIPTRVDVLCEGSTNSGTQSYSQGIWAENSNGGSSQYSVGDTFNAGTNIPYGVFSNTNICKWGENSSNVFTGTLTTSTSGFTITTNNLSANRTIDYIATYDSDGDLGY